MVNANALCLQVKAQYRILTFNFYSFIANGKLAIVRPTANTIPPAKSKLARLSHLV